MICLVIIFNHRYDGNIPKLRNRYKNRFSNIRFIVPFYGGVDEDVIAVYETSWSFQGYIAQAYKSLKEIECESFFFIADDMIINPNLNENSMKEIFKPDTVYTSEFKPLFEFGDIEWCKRKLRKIDHDSTYMNWNSEIYTSKEAFKVAESKGCSGKRWEVKRDCFYAKGLKGMCAKIKNFILKRKTVQLEYPYMAGYSDIFIIPKNELGKISHAFGVAASMRIFVELAIPTFLFLYSKKIESFQSLGYTITLWNDSIEQREEASKRYGYSIERLMGDFSDNKLLCIHPVKLTQWK